MDWISARNYFRLSSLDDDLVKEIISTLVSLPRPEEDLKHGHPFFHELVEQSVYSSASKLLKEFPIEIKIGDLYLKDKYGYNVIERVFNCYCYNIPERNRVIEMLAYDPSTKTVREDLIKEWKSCMFLIDPTYLRSWRYQRRPNIH